MKKTLPALAALSLLAACSSNDDAPPPPADNAAEMLDVTNEAVGVPEAPATMNMPEVPATNLTVEDAPEPTVDERERIQADADATGMTARVNRDDEPTTTNDTSVVSEEK